MHRLSSLFGFRLPSEKVPVPPKAESGHDSADKQTLGCSDQCQTDVADLSSLDIADDIAGQRIDVAQNVGGHSADVAQNQV